MDCSMPGLSVLHHLPEFAQTHVYRVSDVIQPSHSLLFSSPLALNLSQHQSLFQRVGSLHQVATVLELPLQPNPVKKKKRTTTLAPGYFWAGNSGPLGCGDGSRRLGQHPRPWLAEDAS